MARIFSYNWADNYGKTSENDANLQHISNNDMVKNREKVKQTDKNLPSIMPWVHFRDRIQVCVPCDVVETPCSHANAPTVLITLISMGRNRIWVLLPPCFSKLSFFLASLQNVDVTRDTNDALDTVPDHY